MQQALIAVASTCANVAIRYWMKDKETYLVNSILDIAKLARKLGCDVFAERHLDRNINEYISYFAEKLHDSKMLDGIDENRKIEILTQVTKDISSVNFSSLDFTKKILEDVNWKNEISINSYDERKLWSEKEQGIYNNVVRFSSDAISSFISELPSYSADAIKVLYQSNSAALDTIQQQLDRIIKIIDSTSGVSNDFREFETDYLRDVYKKNQKIEIFGSGLNRGTKRYDISTSYIELSCSEKNYEDTHIELSDALNKHMVLWIAGEAGSGKTTFVQWLTTQGITDTDNCLQGLIPVFVKLRNCSFPFDLEEYIKKEWKLECPRGWIDHLVKYDKLLLLLDGLDEITPYERENIYSFVEDLVDEIRSKKKTKSKIVITTRPYVEDSFEINHGNYSILRMNTKNIEKFVLYWHRTIMGDDSEGDAKARVLVDNIKTSSSLKSIAGTPLLCAMICALNYVSNETIPTNRNELYEKCCQMLIEDRDKERRIKVGSDELDKLDYTKKTILLSELSLYMLECEKVEIEKKDVISFVKKYIKNSTIIDSGSIRENPLLLIDYLIRRTGILREPSNGKIDYIHKTFMEYLGAKAIVRNESWSLVDRKLMNPFWKETIIMCFNYMNQSIATKTLNNILQEHDKYHNDELLFMASLCAQNASDVNIKVSEKINEKIKKLIPPLKSDIDRLAFTGTYIIPFLVNKEDYNNEQRNNCLLLLDMLLHGDPEIEAVCVLLSYLLYDCCSDNVIYAAHLLLQYSDEVIEEYEIREQVYSGICNSITTDGNCIVSWDALYLCSIPSNKKNTPISKAKRLTILNDCECAEWCLDKISNRIYTLFGNVTEIRIENIVDRKMMACIKYMPKVEKISLHVADDRDMLLMYLPRYACVEHITELEYESDELGYICDSDFVEYRELRRLKLVIINPRIEIDFHDWSVLPRLEEVLIVVEEMAYWDLQEQLRVWKEKYPDIEFELQVENSDYGDVSNGQV